MSAAYLEAYVQNLVIFHAFGKEIWRSDQFTSFLSNAVQYLLAGAS
jgi:hypothetical protein